MAWTYEDKVFAARVAADGQVLDTTPLWLNNGLSYPVYVDVASNGQDYLVAWGARPLVARRITANGVLLDPSGIVIGNSPGFDEQAAIASDGTNWLVSWKTNTPIPSRRVSRVAANGTLLDPTGIEVLPGQGTWSASLAFGAGTYLLINQTGFNTSGLWMTRLGTNGTPLGPPVQLGTGSSVDLSFNGHNFVATWEDTRSGRFDVYVARVEPTQGTLLDPQGLALTRSPGYDEVNPRIASDGARGSLVIHWGKDLAAQYQQTRVFAQRFIDQPGPNGSQCSRSEDCTSSYCVDGVCCDTACGGGASTDCQACSTAAGAAADGQCGPIVDQRVCRWDAAPCDAPERCDGTHLECPADVLAPMGQVCRPASSVCDVPEACDGASMLCPEDLYRPDGLECDSWGPCYKLRCERGYSCGRVEPVVCTAPDACRVANECDPSLGCTSSPKPDGTACSDGNACTEGDACHDGACSPGSSVACEPPRICHAGYCDPSNGACSFYRWRMARGVRTGMPARWERRARQVHASPELRSCAPARMPATPQVRASPRPVRARLQCPWMTRPARGGRACRGNASVLRMRA